MRFPGQRVTLFAGTIKRIHVNQHNIRDNIKDGGNRPVITVKANGKNYKCHKVEISASSEVVYHPEKPLACGAKVWVETRSQIVCRGVIAKEDYCERPE